MKTIMTTTVMKTRIPVRDNPELFFFGGEEDIVSSPMRKLGAVRGRAQIWRALTTTLTKTIIFLESEITQKDSC
jgi:hypothetical protein